MRLSFGGSTFRSQAPMTHGTRYGYKKKKCRCRECQTWQTRNMRTYYARHPRPNNWDGYNSRRTYVSNQKERD